MSRNTSKLVSFTQSCGLELNINLVLEEKSTRQDQKLQTLIQYVQKYPSGWKKRLELANLLYAMGWWEQGVEEYYQVLVQQPQLIQVRLKLGKILQLMGRKAEAVEVYESALSMKTSPPSPLLAKATVYTQVIESLPVLELPHPNPPDALGRKLNVPVSPLGEGGLRGVKPGSQSNSDLCVQLSLAKEMGVCQDGVRFFQVSEATRLHILGLIAVCQDDTQVAILAFESAANLESSNPSHWLALGQVQMIRENAVAASSAFDAVLSLKPDDLVALLANYDALLAVGNWREAGRRLSQAKDLAADDFRVLKRLANCRCQRRLVTGKKGKRTKQIITAALKLAPDAPDIHDVLAYYHIFRGEWEKGVEVLQQFTESHPNNPNGWYYYGRCLFHTGEYQRAMEAMLLAHRLYPDNCEIYRGLCEILTSCPSLLLGGNMTSPLAPLLQGEGSKRNLAALVEEMLERFPQRWSVWATAGRVLVESLGEIERGCRVSEEGTRLQPQLADAWFRHGRVLGLAHKHGDALEALEKGWKLLSQVAGEQGAGCKAENARGYVQSVSAAVWLGESYRGLGDDGMSRKWWEKACDLAGELQDFDSVLAGYWQGRAFEGFGDLTGAVEAYRGALSGQLLFPVRGEVKAEVKRLKGRLRKGAGG